jgi:hypothetical protein
MGDAMIASDQADWRNKNVAPDSEFALTLKRIFRERRPMRVIETGTHVATGTTRIIGEAIREAGLTGVQFISIEVNPQYAQQARANAQAAQIPVDLRQGLSVPRSLLPTPEQVRREYVEQVDPAVFVDHPDHLRVQTYVAETDFPYAHDDLLGIALRAWHGRPDFVLLDSAGHMGIIEYEYTLSLLEGPCTLMLDDTRHVKHAQSVARIKQDPRFTIEVDSPEKFGFVAAHFKPHGVVARLANVFRGRR